MFLELDYSFVVTFNILISWKQILITYFLWKSSIKCKLFFCYFSQDYIRTGTYQRAILSNMSDFKDKIILDVGAGSGILSFFAAQAGARKVYAVEASSMAQHCEVFWSILAILKIFLVVFLVYLKRWQTVFFFYKLKLLKLKWTVLYTKVRKISTSRHQLPRIEKA